MGILTDGMKQYINVRTKQQYNQSAYNARLIEYGVEGIKDLEFIAQKVNEESGFKQQDAEKILGEIFAPQDLKKLLNAILLSKHKDRDRQLETAKTMIEMLPDIAQSLCNDDFLKFAQTGHDLYRASLYAIKFAQSGYELLFRDFGRLDKDDKREVITKIQTQAHKMIRDKLTNSKPRKGN